MTRVAQLAGLCGVDCCCQYVNTSLKQSRHTPLRCWSIPSRTLELIPMDRPTSHHLAGISLTTISRNWNSWYCISDCSTDINIMVTPYCPTCIHQLIGSCAMEEIYQCEECLRVIKAFHTVHEYIDITLDSGIYGDCALPLPPHSYWHGLAIPQIPCPQ